MNEAADPKTGPNDLSSRLDVMRRMMSERKIDLVVAATTGFDMIDYYNTAMHLAGVRPLGPSVLLITDTDMRLVASPADDADRLAAFGPACEWSVVDDLLHGVQSMLASMRVRPSKVGAIDTGRIGVGPAAALLDMFGEMEDFSAEFYAATAPKTGAEIADARKATVIAEAGYRLLLELARPGIRECDLAVALNLHMRELGANDSFLLLTSGPSKKAIMPSTERVIEAGDLILVELSPSLNGQFVQICRTISVGKPSDVLQEKYGLLIDSMFAGCRTVRPDIPMSDVCGAMNGVLAEAGYGDYARPPFIKRRGHGLGSGSVAPGDVALDNTTTLESGMLFMVHPNQFLPETGYMMCGEPVLVTADGSEILTETTAALGSVEA